jgi:hypothetical protein
VHPALADRVLVPSADAHRKPNETVRMARSEQPSTLQCLRTMCSGYSPILIGAPHEQSIRVWKMSRPT